MTSKSSKRFWKTYNAFNALSKAKNSEEPQKVIEKVIDMALVTLTKDLKLTQKDTIAFKLMHASDHLTEKLSIELGQQPAAKPLN